MNKNQTLEVVPLLALPRNGNQHYSYLPPAGVKIGPGDLVRIPFAQGLADGLVLQYSNSKFNKLKTIQAVLNESFASPADLDWLTTFSNVSFESLSLMSKSFVAVRKQFHFGSQKLKTKSPRKKSSVRRTADVSVLRDFLLKTKKGQILVLIPEIVYANSVSHLCDKHHLKYVLFSNKLTASEKKVFAETLSTGQPCVVISSHSGIFLPFVNLAGIVVYEPAIASHRQWDRHPRYDARIGAYLRAQVENLPLVFFARIPSLDINTLLPKPSTEHAISLPAILPLSPSQNVTEILPWEIIRIIGDRLEQKQKVLIFNDILGYESAYLCGDCRIILRCDICDSVLQRAANGLYCAVCKRAAGNLRAFCPRCGSPNIHALKSGTHMLQQLIQREFPAIPTARIDREIKNAAVSDINNAQIVIATQKIFSYVQTPLFDLCYAPSAETIFNANSFDAQERGLVALCRLASLIKSENNPAIIIKTAFGAAKVFRLLSQKQMESLIDDDLADRKTLMLPPFASVLYFDKVFKSPQAAKKETQIIIQKIRKARPKIVCYRQTVTQRGAVIGKIFLRGNNNGLYDAAKFVPNSWNIDQNISLTSLGLQQ